MHDFQKVIEDFIVLFRELTTIEDMKFRAAAANRAATVEECMNKEQAMILRLKGLEKDRERTQEEAGFKGLTFREILTSVPKADQEILSSLFDELSRLIQTFQEVSANASQVIEVNLHEIEKAMDVKGVNIYTDNGSPVGEEHRMTSRKV